MDLFSLHLLGGFAVHRGDAPIDLPPACQRVVALLALKRRPVHRLWVCATLWPHVQTRRAVASLRSAMWRLRPLGADPLLDVDHQFLQMASDVSVDWHDALDRIDRLLAGDIEPQLVSELLPLLRAGELLDKWTEPWVSHERDRYHGLRMLAFDTLGHGPTKPAPHHPCGVIRAAHTHRPALRSSNDSGDPSQA